MVFTSHGFPLVWVALIELISSAVGPSNSTALLSESQK